MVRRMHPQDTCIQPATLTRSPLAETLDPAVNWSTQGDRRGIAELPMLAGDHREVTG